MGNEPSSPSRPTTIYGRISKAVPPLAPQYGPNKNSEWVDKGVKAFVSEGDRDQFICGLISLLSANGSVNLDNHDIKLLFSRRKVEAPITTTPPTPSTTKPLMPGSSEPNDDGTRLVATLVAVDETGVIRVKVASDTDGRDVAEAFRAFKKDVELKLGKLLSDVPNSPPTSSLQNRMPVQTGRTVPVTSGDEGVLMDAPPAYGDVNMKKKRMG